MIASSIFHFTKYRWLKVILDQGGFKPFYNIEPIRDLIPGEEFIAFPMVCFCDIPLKFVGSHTKKFGGFGIGLRKEWAKKKGVNPVMYRMKGSQTTTLYKDIYESQARQNRGVKELYNEVVQRAGDANIEQIETFLGGLGENMLKHVQLSYFLKPFEEKVQNGFIEYYVEREWRYVPAVCEFRFTSSNEVTEKRKLNEEYHSIDTDRLIFALDDIEHLVVPKRTDVKRIINFIRKIKVNEADKYNLVQKVIDIESINRDI